MVDETTMNETGDGGEQGPAVDPVLADLSGDPVADAIAYAASTTGEVTAILRRLGWRIGTTGERTQAVRHFQDAYLFGDALSVDGVAGQKTMAALSASDARRAKGQTTMSAHFSFAEMRCRCSVVSALNTGGFANCARIWVTRANVVQAEKYRTAIGKAVTVVSACRCPGHNASVGGATASQHLLGKATDFPALETVSWFEDRKIYKPGGLGANEGTNRVRHGDVGPNRGWSYTS